MPSHDSQNLGNRIVKLIHNQQSDYRETMLQELLDELNQGTLNPYEIINVLNIQNETPSEPTYTLDFGKAVMLNENASVAEMYITLLDKLQEKGSDILNILTLPDQWGQHLGHYVALYQDAEIMRRYLRIWEDILNEAPQQQAPKLREILAQPDHQGYTLAHTIAWYQDSHIVQRMIDLMNNFAKHKQNRWLFDDVLNKGIKRFDDQSKLEDAQKQVSTLSHFIAYKHNAKAMHAYIHMLSDFQRKGIMNSEEAAALITTPDPDGYSALSYTVAKHNDGQIVYDICQNFGDLQHEYEKLAHAKEALAQYIKSLDWNEKDQALKQACGQNSENNNLHQVFLVARPKAFLPKSIVTLFKTPGPNSGWLKDLNQELQKMEPTTSVYTQNRYSTYQPANTQQNDQKQPFQPENTQSEKSQQEPSSTTSQNHKSNNSEQQKTYRDAAAEQAKKMAFNQK